MEQYILDLIKENNRVIIPNFGAFIVAKEKGFTILFNNFLSFNDGLLVDHVMTKEKVDKDTATAQVDAYVDKLKETLDSTGLYSIPGLGTFTKDTNGILRFAQSEDINTDAVPQAAKEEDLLDIVGIEEEVPKPVEPEMVKPEVKKTEEPPAIVTPNKSEVELPKSEKKETVIVKPPVQEKTKEKKPAEEPKPSTSSSYQYNDNENKNKSILIFVISIAALVIIIGGYFIFFHGKNNTPEKTVAKNELVKPVIKKEPAAAESTKVTQAIEQADAGIVAGPSIKKTEDKPTTATPAAKATTATAKPHHIIVGSFKDAANAERFVERLKSQGFADSKTLPRGNMTLVSIESFAKIREAEAKQEEILNQKKMESWILTRK